MWYINQQQDKFTVNQLHEFITMKIENAKTCRFFLEIESSFRPKWLFFTVKNLWRGTSDFNNPYAHTTFTPLYQIIGSSVWKADTVLAYNYPLHMKIYIFSFGDLTQLFQDFKNLKNFAKSLKERIKNINKNNFVSFCKDLCKDV